jgi:hypothetical protein
MNTDISERAKAIIAVGIQAAQASDSPEKDLSAVDQAVADAVGRLSLSYPPGKEAPVVDTLLDIVQSYVREMISQPQRGLRQ